MFGGNSNWRGPIWMPVNALIIRALLQFYAYFGDDFMVECPTGSGQLHEALPRWPRSSRADWPASSCGTQDGERPVYGGDRKFQDDPHWRD